MRFIGVTGGVGAGKSRVLKFLEAEYGAYVIRADELAKELMKPKTQVNTAIKEAFSDAADKLFDEEDNIRPDAMAKLIYSDDKSRGRLDAIVHPAVKEYILNDAKEKRARGSVELYILEAALLIEDGYDKICDELWYIYASEVTRIARLMISRGYTETKARSIMAKQLSDDMFRKYCNVVIDNDGEEENTFSQIRALLG